MTDFPDVTLAQRIDNLERKVKQYDEDYAELICCVETFKRKMYHDESEADIAGCIICSAEEHKKLMQMFFQYISLLRKQEKRTSESLKKLEKQLQKGIDEAMETIPEL